MRRISISLYFLVLIMSLVVVTPARAADCADRCDCSSNPGHCTLDKKGLGCWVEFGGANNCNATAPDRAACYTRTAGSGTTCCEDGCLPTCIDKAEGPNNNCCGDVDDECTNRPRLQSWRLDPNCPFVNGNITMRVLAWDVNSRSITDIDTAVWSLDGGQNDLRWYDHNYAGNLLWPSSPINLSNHPTTVASPWIAVHMYLHNNCEQWRFWDALDFCKGVPPTAVITSPSPSTIHYQNIGDTVTFTARATDECGHLGSMNLYRIREENIAANGPWIPVGTTVSGNCAGGGESVCTDSRTWTLTAADEGCWRVVVNAAEDNGLASDDLTCGVHHCTGNPNASAIPSWSQSCHATDDEVRICINQPPSITRIDGPTTVYVGDINFYNVLAMEPDCTEMTTNWSYTAGDLPVTNTIRIRARGSRSADTWPDMDVYLGNEAAGGAKALQCHFDVNTSSWTTYTCGSIGKSITSLDIVFPNDDYDGPGLDTNLYVDWIEVDGRRIEAESTNPRVYYDRGAGGQAFDGDDFCSATTMLAGREALGWSGSLRFPIPWQAPNTVVPVTLTATVRDASGASDSASINITVLGRRIEGWIWEVTDSDNDGDIDDNDCNDSNGLSSGSSALIRHSETDGADPDPTLQTGQTGTWHDPPNSSYSFDFSNIPSGANTLRLSLPPPTGRPNFRYILTCLEDSTSGVISSGSAAITVAGATTNADLGYRVMSNGWFQTRPVDGGSVGGNVYATDISMSVPREGEVAGGFESFLAVGNGAALSAGNISVADGDGNSRVAAGIGSTSERSSNTYAEELDTVSSMQIWPDIYAAVPPSNAIDVTTVSDCDNFLGDNSLDPAETYVATSSCLGRALNDLGGASYRLQGNGVVVVYITGTDPVVFSDNFRAQNAGERVVFVSTAPFVIDPTLGEAAVTPATRPHIEAMLIANSTVLADSTVTFPTGGDTTVPADGLPDDLSVILEGPLVARGAISFGRDRGLSNDLPAVVVKYNPMYMIEIADQEMNQSASPTSPSYTGLSIVNVSWGRNE